MQTILNNQKITMVKHNTKSCRLINILQGRLHYLFQQRNFLRLSDICRIIPRLCAGDSTMYRLILLTSPQGNLPTPTTNPKFFCANKGCNSGDLTYKCGISVFLFPCFERIRKSKQCNSSYPAYAIHPNSTYLILTAIFHFSLNVGILEKRNKF